MSAQTPDEPSSQRIDPFALAMSVLGQPEEQTWTLEDLLASPLGQRDLLLTKRIVQASWPCERCGLIVPRLYRGGRHLIVRRVQCTCGPEP